MPMFMKPGAWEWNTRLALEYAKHGVLLNPTLGYWAVEVEEDKDSGRKWWVAFRDYRDNHWLCYGETLEELHPQMNTIEKAIWEGV